MQNKLAVIALVVSLLSIAYSGWVHYHVHAAVQQRERELVRHWAPQLRSLYADLTPSTNLMRSDPQTLEELFAPLFRIVGQIGADDTNQLRSPK